MDIEQAPESEETKEIEVDAQNADVPSEQAQSQQIEQEPEETKVDEPDNIGVNGQSTDPPPSTIGILCFFYVFSVLTLTL